jgi:cob(I)alamin adenosyltransferase
MRKMNDVDGEAMNTKNAEKRKGYLIVITGDGKGKTTAAIGMVVRALGRNMRVLFVQFLKNAEYGEHAILKKLPGCTVKVFGRGFCRICGDSLPLSEHKKSAAQALEYVRQELVKNRYDMIVMDEINCALSARLISARAVYDVLKKKPFSTHVVLTGRGASKGLIRRADLVSEICDIRHPYHTGFAAQKGIEF